MRDGTSQDEVKTTMKASELNDEDIRELHKQYGIEDMKEEKYKATEDAMNVY